MGNEPADYEKTATVTQELVKLLGPLESSVRKRAVEAAMVLMGESSSQTVISTRPADRVTDRGALDIASFFGREENLKPAENTYLCAAYLFSLYGPAAFSIQDVRDVAREAGVVLPDRPDMTLRQAG